MKPDSSVMYGGRTRDRHKLKREIQTECQKTFSTSKTAMQRSKLPRKVVQPPALEIHKIKPDKALSILL